MFTTYNFTLGVDRQSPLRASCYLLTLEPNNMAMWWQLQTLLPRICWHAQTFSLFTINYLHAITQISWRAVDNTLPSTDNLGERNYSNTRGNTTHFLRNSVSAIWNRLGEIKRPYSWINTCHS